jgi:hypothetical protein
VTAICDWLFNRRVFARVLRREHVLCIGDSHTEVMGHVHVPGVWIRAKPLPGATASGILNPNSATQSLKMFTARLERAKHWQQVLVLLGEVDCGFVIWHRAERHNLDVDQQLVYTLDTYTKFISKLVGMGFRRIIVLSAPLPTIGDCQSEWGDVANLRSEITASQRERTNLTLRFNAQLRDACESIGALFVDVTTGHMDACTGLVDRAFLRETFANHHLADKPYAQLIETELGKVLSLSSA